MGRSMVQASGRQEQGVHDAEAKVLDAPCWPGEAGSATRHAGSGQRAVRVRAQGECWVSVMVAFETSEAAASRSGSARTSRSTAFTAHTSTIHVTRRGMRHPSTQRERLDR